jgi:hypothetical protein
MSGPEVLNQALDLIPDIIRNLDRDERPNQISTRG